MEALALATVEFVFDLVFLYAIRLVKGTRLVRWIPGRRRDRQRRMIVKERALEPRRCLVRYVGQRPKSAHPARQPGGIVVEAVIFPSEFHQAGSEARVFGREIEEDREQSASAQEERRRKIYTHSLRILATRPPTEPRLRVREGTTMGWSVMHLAVRPQTLIARGHSRPSASRGRVVESAEELGA